MNTNTDTGRQYRNLAGADGGRDGDYIYHSTHRHTRKEIQRDAPYIVFIVLIAFVLSQLGIYIWKQYHIISYEYSAIIGVWVVPVLYTVWQHLHNHRFIYMWLIFTCITVYCLYAVRQKPLQRSTPRIVYGFFYVIFHFCYAIAMIGGICIIADLLGITFAISTLIPALDSLFPLSWYAIYLVLYGLYFGIVGRDMASIATQRMATTIGYKPTYTHTHTNSRTSIQHDESNGNGHDNGNGYHTPKRRSSTSTHSPSSSSSQYSYESPRKQLSIDVCALCDSTLYNSIEETYTLSCGHVFHEWCLKGWTLIGKRDVCGVCNEKVDLTKFTDRFWERPTLLWGRLLDAVRWLIVFNPLVLIIANWTLATVY